VYALGAILYECLTGRPPFQGENPVEIILKVAGEDAVPPRKLCPRLPRDLETICLKCLEKAARNRYATARELAEDLERFLAGESIHARPVGLVGRFTRWCARQPAFAATLVALSLFYLNHLVLLWWGGVPGEGGTFHVFVTLLILTWLGGACLFQKLQFRPGWVTLSLYSWCALEVVCLTAFVWKANGPQSSLAPGFVLLIAGAALRGRVGLVWFVTALGVLGYGAVAVEAYLEYLPSAEVYRSVGFDHSHRSVTPYRAFIFLLLLGMMGLMCYLLVRRNRAAGSIGS
jgi:serine/threonine-protein kinase